jgi:hypothetical protein
MAMADRCKSRYLVFMADGGVKGGTKVRDKKRGEFLGVGLRVDIYNPLTYDQPFIWRYNLYFEVLSD